ncbi:MAG TPA: murein biosynthesis integral membrane protein MurJ [Clostridiaceae bacterium]|nr:murein biosynthesis integral membrane protein MurJ [Clostridiaceae bacterium]
MKQKRNLTSAAFIVMSSIVISRITGYFRVMLIPNKLTEKVVADSYIMAFKMTDLMYNLLVGGAIAAALIPVLTGYLERGEEEEGWKAVGTFINVVCLSMVFICVVGIIFAPKFVPLIARGFDEEGIKLTVRLTRILFPSVSFIMLAGLTNGVLNSYQRFAASSYGPVIYNIGSIMSLFFLSRYSVELVAFGVMLSSFVYFLFQLSFAVRNLKYYRFRIYLRHPGFKRLFNLAVPSLLSSTINQVNVIISAMFVTLFRSPGSVNAFNMADTTWQMPYGIFAQGIGIAILPTMSARYAVGDVKDYKDILNKGLKSILLLSIPSAAGLVVLSEPVIRTIFQWSKGFYPEYVTLASRILVFFSVALITQSIVATMSRAFYAVNDTKSPLYVGAGTILMNLAICYLFYRYTSLGVEGMALAYSITSTINAFILIFILNKKVDSINLKSFCVFLLKTFLASGIMGLAVFLLSNVMDFNTASKFLQVLYLIAAISVGALIYFATVLVLKVDEAVYMYETIRLRVKKLMKKN